MDDQELWNLLMEILYHTVHKNIGDISLHKRLTTENVNAICKLAAKHSLVYLVSRYILVNAIPVDSSIKATLQHIGLKTVYNLERMKYVLNEIHNIFNEAGISYIPLKGAVLRAYYPEEEMRTSCDIDVLIHEKDLETAKSLLINKHGYTDHGKGSHDVSLFSPQGVHLELHYDLIEDGEANESAKVLRNVWNMVKAREGFEYWYEMPDDLFYFYHIAHMAKHFENGGCGIRPFIDLWFLDRIESADIAKRNRLLQEGKLLKFANVVRRLSRVWFDGEEHDNITQQMEEYILRGGVYGTNTNRVMVQQQKKGGRIKYALSKIFIPYDVIKFHYPILQKYRCLTPIMEIRRWFKLIFCGHLKRTTNELKYNNSISNDDATRMQIFLRDIGLVI